MRHINRYALTLTSAALMCGGAVVAQERTAPAAPATQHPVAQARPLRVGDVQASKLIGAAVKSTSGESIGSVYDLIVSAGADVASAVISVGGVLGVGDKKVAIPYKELSIAEDGRTLYLNISEEELKSRPAFDANAEEHAAANRTVERTPEPNAAAPRATAQTPAPASSATARRANDTPARTTAGATDRSPAPAARQANAAPPRTLKASEQPASSLIGAAVVDSQDSKIGKIHDLIVSAGRQSVQAVLSVGGGLNPRMVAVPLDELTIKRNAAEDRRHEPDRVQSQLTVSQLGALPEFRYE